MEKGEVIIARIAEALLIDYTSVYYVDADTNEYYGYSIDPGYHSLQIEQKGSDFFGNMARDVSHVVYEEDRELLLDNLRRDKLLREMKTGSMQSVVYRLMIDGKPVYHTLRMIREAGAGEDYFILGVLNVDKEVRSRQETEQLEKEREVFNQIAKTLARRYDVIYYVDCENDSYMEFASNDLFWGLEIPEEGIDFFSESRRNIEKVVHPDDKDRVRAILWKDRIISSLENRKQFSLEYRLVINGESHHIRLTATLSGDRSHLIVGVENIDEDVRREKEHLKALKSANEAAKRDELTGIKNKNAYQELEDSMQTNINNGVRNPFALVVCDLNNLKKINDTLGHKTGDEYIKDASMLICDVFRHSPVFRVGGDEFVAVLTGRDYYERDRLFYSIRKKVLENKISENGPVISTGMSVFDPVDDNAVSEVFKRADKQMYENKKKLKESDGEVLFSDEGMEMMIPDDQKRRLDSLFEAFAMVSEGNYVFIGNIPYNYSRWSKAAVDLFGLPGEYFYNPTVIWENNIHPDDVEGYRIANQKIFEGTSSGHDAQFRARKRNGEYDVCSCKGIIIHDERDEPAYFVGFIRDHGMQSHIDPLIGMRNQYGFFEDMNSCLIDKALTHVCIVGISRFVEINEIHGYLFGNTVLQRFGRYLLDDIGDKGIVYRLDGTKFAILSKVLSINEIAERYEALRDYFRDGFIVEDKPVILDLNAGLVTIDDFSVDVQTVFTCLNFAYADSKLRRNGDLVEFFNDLTEENKQQIEKLHVIRASIMQEYKGFCLYYQPVVDAMTEELTGAEALIRWRSPEYGMVMPDQFIPLLEKDSLFADLGRWILRTAVMDAKKLLGNHPNFIINVNLSYAQLEKADFADMVMQVLDEADYPPENLCLEITERCRLLDMELLKNVITKLKGRGVRFALDDFGTGFSSIGLVMNLPFDTIKIDRSFVAGIEDDEKEEHLIQDFTDAAATYGAKVCVEGIETAGMRDILRKFNVHSFQGYYYSRPLDFYSFLAWKTQRQ